MFTAAKSPMILSGDSFMLESTDDFTNVRDIASFGEDTITSKQDGLDELSTHLPLLERNDNLNDGAHEDYPFTVHSSVLDSVFSNEDNGEANQTPMFDELDFIIEGTQTNLKEEWLSLFGNDSEFKVGEEALSPVRDESDSSKEIFDAPTNTNTSETSRDLVTPVSSRDSPEVESAKRSLDFDSLGCVPYAKKRRTKPLDPVTADGDDSVALKRARNTEAARRSRARKMERMGQLEMKVEDLLNEKSGLESEVSRLRSLLTQNGIQF